MRRVQIVLVLAIVTVCDCLKDSHLARRCEAMVLSLPDYHLN